ncbi:hypothetical protein BDA96_01G235700 [Sorghum bicolor]|uniref:Uncharacterized protein n=2 Tax=Sorghum bicolor TaxID=4558 RepID=A0A921S0T9_SORBI|nr:hypothetical protein BDA96_01G235700 [Sorghum bicolor]OQU91641.1 hypothetical protein SORBI_3001G221350 [Sorghum bicolor]
MDATQPDVGLGHKRKACHIYMDKKNLPIILDFSFKLSLVKFEGTNVRSALKPTNKRQHSVGRHS